jgi:hypothetical protein
MYDSTPNEQLEPPYWEVFNKKAKSWAVAE